MASNSGIANQKHRRRNNNNNNWQECKYVEAHTHMYIHTYTQLHEEFNVIEQCQNTIQSKLSNGAGVQRRQKSLHKNTEKRNNSI